MALGFHKWVSVYLLVSVAAWTNAWVPRMGRVSVHHLLAVSFILPVDKVVTAKD